ncbi:M48 family metalloprotease [Rhodospirillum rubrum]|uniref:Peptidase M48 n=1 Tax=Rhodospirillum rubrum (strain ATCC 11170 / ATH 1.1.1 / DSM 467 / LMG 4362 / NCIMB 8255 / S1) TaxID=269796 RepID=Q2RRM0_RHORT|nr:M48 family metalloprotease [Rhodospirillum rubrum]ABC23225.1 Peptidase M48 [Rhodospirillum rubrum ATCC 11170]MBK5954859.1 peptidase M48 [Rhodospirillum rubrum]HAP99858.1 peptidase M48 [Rhodospirillum rubrum]HCF19138.1 peptidase M48 [Rhodospirillum rubrum]
MRLLIAGRLFFGLGLALWALGAGPSPARAAGMSLIRDAEIENTIAMIATPLLRAASIGDRAITFRLINDDTINAFATTEMRVFVYTGLFLKTEGPDELKGVIAHEMGHLAGGHLLRMKDEMANASMTALVGMLAGAAAGIASGRGDVGSAVMMGTNQAAMRGFLTFSRTQESSADSFAMRMLDATGQSAAGMLKFFRKLGDQEALITASQDPYVRTHPLTRDRITAVADHVAHSRFSDVPPSPAEVLAYQRAKAKLMAFLKSTGATLAAYPATDRSVAARYARAIAYYRAGDLGRALPLIDGLIAEDPNDPYFEELRGQMLFENQRLREALGSYTKAARLAPTEPLILVSLAHVQVELGDRPLLENALTNLNAALGLDPTNSFAWRQMANASGKLGDEAMAAYYLAEMALSQGDPREALAHAKRAEGRIPKGSPQGLRLQDLIAEAERQKKRQEDRD